MNLLLVNTLHKSLTNETAVLALLWAKYFQNRRAKYLLKQRTSENLIEILKEGS